jgi:hypothetical protein
LKEKRRGKVTKGVLFLHNNVPAHRALATQKKMAYLGFQCPDHPPYSPELARSIFHLFLELKKIEIREGVGYVKTQLSCILFYIYNIYVCV